MKTKISSSVLKFVSASFDYKTINDKNFCGYNDWKFGAAKSIIDRDCFPQTIP